MRLKGNFTEKAAIDFMAAFILLIKKRRFLQRNASLFAIYSIIPGDSTSGIASDSNCVPDTG